MHPSFCQGSQVQPCTMILELEEVFLGLVRRITVQDLRTVVLPLYGSPPRHHHPHSSMSLSSSMLPLWDRPCNFQTGRRSTITSIYRDRQNRAQSVQQIVKFQRENHITLNRLQREAIGSCGSVMCKSMSSSRDLRKWGAYDMIISPNNTTHEELWHFFNVTVPITNTQSDAEPWRGPSSIFLISRSSCAFVNLSSQTDLERAVSFFNGKPLRPWDPRCPRMVCRVRRKDDDLKSGVGAQRGTGMHRQWVKKDKDKEKELEESKTGQMSAVTVSSGPPSPTISAPAPDGPGRRRDSIVGEEKRKFSSGSYASTNSSFLMKHFPRRIFILKSLTTVSLIRIRYVFWIMKLTFLFSLAG